MYADFRLNFRNDQTAPISLTVSSLRLLTGFYRRHRVTSAKVILVKSRDSNLLRKTAVLFEHTILWSFGSVRNSLKFKDTA